MRPGPSQASLERVRRASRPHGKWANSCDARLLELRYREPRRREILPCVRLTTRIRTSPTGGEKGRHDRLLGPQGVDGDGREARLGVPARGDDALLRFDA